MADSKAGRFMGHRLEWRFHTQK